MSFCTRPTKPAPGAEDAHARTRALTQPVNSGNTSELCAPNQSQNAFMYKSKYENILRLPRIFFLLLSVYEQNPKCNLKWRELPADASTVLGQYSNAFVLEHTWDKNSSTWPAFLWQFFLSKSLWESKLLKNSYQRLQMIDILLKYILWKTFVTKPFLS